MKVVIEIGEISQNGNTVNPTMPDLDSEKFEAGKIKADFVPAGTDTLKQNSNGFVTLLNQARIFAVSQKARVQNLSALVVINFITAGLGFITTVKIANVLGKENFGEFAYALAIGAYAAAVVRYGFDRTLIRDLTHYPDRFSDLVFASLALRAFMLVLVSAGLVIWKLVFVHAAGLSWAAIIIVIGVALRSLDLQPVYDTWRQFKRHAIYDLIQKCLYFACIWFIAVVYPDKLAISWIGIVALCSIMLYLFLQHRWAMNNIGRVTTSISFLSKSALSMFGQNFWIWLAAIGCLSFGSLNQLVLKHYRGAAELGGYAAAWQLAAVTQVLLLGIARIGNPATAHITRLEISAKMRTWHLFKYSGVMFLAVVPFCFSALLFPRFILTTVFSPEYASAAPVMRIMAMYILIFSLGLVASQYVISARMEKVYFTSVIAGGVLSVLLCLFLIPKSGGMGAALSLLIAHSVSMGLYWIAMILHVRNHE